MADCESHRQFVSTNATWWWPDETTRGRWWHSQLAEKYGGNSTCQTNWVWAMMVVLWCLAVRCGVFLLCFRWGGRNSRGKIAAHVHFDDVLDLTPFCFTAADKSSSSERLEYQLVAVVMHHGRGFGSGHYTAYCYNPCAGWVSCWNKSGLCRLSNWIIWVLLNVDMSASLLSQISEEKCYLCVHC